MHLAEGAKGYVKVIASFIPNEVEQKGNPREKLNKKRK